METVKAEDAVTSPQNDATNPDLLKEEATQTDETVQSTESETDQAQQTDDEQEVEIVLEGDDGSQPKHKTPFGFKKRIDKLNAKLDTAEEVKTQAQKELEIAQERNRLLQIALDQKGQKPELPKLPNPNDFDGDTDDPRYIEAVHQYHQKIVADALEKHTAKQQPKQQQTSVDPDLRQKQEKHYQRASELRVKDYEETEDAAIGVLGNEIANHIIQNSDRSSELLYHFGKNPERAEEIADMIKTNPIKGVLEIGRLEARLKTKPKAKTNPLPDPDEELEGRTGGSTGALQRRLDEARKNKGDGSRMDDILAIHKEAKAKGVTLS